MTIIDAVNDPNLFAGFFKDPATWRNWRTALRVVYGLPLRASDAALVSECTGRPLASMPAAGFSTALFLVGRRSGKSRAAAVVGAFEALFGGHESQLSAGERGIVACLAPTTTQAGIVRGYLRALFDAPLLRREVVKESADGFDLRNGIRVAVLAGDFRTSRGFSMVAAIVDELAFFGLDADARVRSDSELIRAVRPGLATTNGKLIAVSSPYAKKGFCYDQFRRHYGKAGAPVLVWNCPSRTMNPTLPQSVVDDALAEDLQAAKSEYLGEFRDDVAEFLPRAVVEACVVPGRLELPPRPGVRYAAFCDLSGGRSDDATLAVGHRDGTTVVIDALRRYKAPHNPYEVVQGMARELGRFGVAGVVGDNYAAEFVAGAFARSGVRYTRCLKAKSALYLELLPRLCAGQIELLDDAVLVGQLAGLERRTRSGGKDVVDHARGAKDDAANAAAGVVEAVGKVKRRAGASDRPGVAHEGRSVPGVVARGGSLTGLPRGA